MIIRSSDTVGLNILSWPVDDVFVDLALAYRYRALTCLLRLTGIQLESNVNECNVRCCVFSQGFRRRA